MPIYFVMVSLIIKMIKEIVFVFPSHVNLVLTYIIVLFASKKKYYLQVALKPPVFAG